MEKVQLKKKFLGIDLSTSSDDEIEEDDSEEDFDYFLKFSSKKLKKIEYSGNISESEEEDEYNIEKRVKPSDYDFFLTTSSDEEEEDESIISRIALKEKKRISTPRAYNFQFTLTDLKNTVDPYYHLNSKKYKEMSSNFRVLHKIQKANRHFFSAMFKESEEEFRELNEKHRGGIFFRCMRLFSKSLVILGGENSKKKIYDKMEILGIINRCDYELTHPQIGEEGDFEICITLLSFLKSFLYLKLQKLVISKLELQKILMEEYCAKIPKLKNGIKKNIRMIDDSLSKNVDPVIDLHVLQNQVLDEEEETEVILEDEKEDDDVIIEEEEEEDGENEENERNKKQETNERSKFTISKVNDDMRELEKILNSKFESQTIQPVANVFKPSKNKKNDISTSEFNDDKFVKKNRLPDGFIMEKKNDVEEKRRKDSPKKKKKNFSKEEEEEEEEEAYRSKMVWNFYTWCKIKINDFDKKFPDMKGDLERIDEQVNSND